MRIPHPRLGYSARIASSCSIWHQWVADVFRANFEGSPGEVGAARRVYVDGRRVVDLWGGLADSKANRAWDKNTIVAVASTTKGTAAICAHLLVQRIEFSPQSLSCTARLPDGGLARAFGENRLPTRFFLDDRAIIRHINRGHGSGYRARARRWLTEMLATRPG